MRGPYHRKRPQPLNRRGDLPGACGAEFIEEYSIDHPNISHFIRMFNNQPNIMPYSDFTEILKGAISRFDGSNKWSGKNGFNQKLEALYRMGFFGIVQEIDEGAMIPPDIEYLPPAKLHGRRYYMDFYYRSNPVGAVHLRVPNEALVAIHPILTNHCNMRPHPTMIVG